MGGGLIDAQSYMRSGGLKDSVTCLSETILNSSDSTIGDAAVTGLSGIVEADETYQQESCKGSREWVEYFADPLNVT